MSSQGETHHFHDKQREKCYRDHADCPLVHDESENGSWAVGARKLNLFTGLYNFQGQMLRFARVEKSEEAEGCCH